MAARGMNGVSQVIETDGDLITPDQARQKVTWYADEIANSWRSTVKGIIATAKLILDADQDPTLTEGAKKSLFVELQKRGIGAATTSKLRQIATFKQFREEDFAVLPPSYNHLYEITTEKLAPKYQTIIERLSSGEDFSEIRTKLTRTTGRAATKAKPQQQVLTLSANFSAISQEAAAAIESFVLQMKGEANVTVKVTPSWNKRSSQKA